MAGMSVSTGLVSGMDTASLVSQLMKVEANPQTLLRNKLVATNADGAGYRAVNLRFDSLRSAAAALATDATWTAAKATSSNPTVTATAGSSALPGSVTFTVSQLATTHSMRSETTWSTTAGDFGATSVSVVRGGTTTPVLLDTDRSGTATLAEAAAAINATKALKLTATVLQTGPSEYRLQVATTTPGAPGVFSVNGGPTLTPLTTGQNAVLRIGSASDGFDVVSTSNTFSGLMPDTTITVSKQGETSTVGIARDSDATAGKVQALVDAANSALQVIADYTAKDSSTATLQGDSTLRALAGRVLDVISSGVDGTSAATIGIQLTKDGRLTFDKARFTDALAADPARTRRLLTATAGSGATAGPVGFAAKMEALAKTASDSGTGTLTLLAKGADTTATDLKGRIADWDRRLALRKENLTRQFTAMETALGALQNQSTWLAGQLAGLPKWS